MHPFLIFFIAFVGMMAILCGIAVLAPKINRFKSCGKTRADKELSKLCKKLSGEELYGKACELINKKGCKIDYNRWQILMSSAADKGYIPAVCEWGIYNKGDNNVLAVELLSLAAKEGNKKATEALYNLYRRGSRGGNPRIEPNQEKAVEIITPLAENGNTAACRLLADYYNFEKRNKGKALDLYLKAAEGGDAEAMVDAAFIYFSKNDLAAHKRLLFKAAEKNYAFAESALANFYRNTDEPDLGTPDLSQAVHWYKRASEHGDPTATYEVGKMYLNGEGVIQDDYKAFIWFQKSDGEGSAYGTYLYGRCYMNGTGVDRDKKKGIELYTKAAEYNGKAQYALGICFLEGDGVEKDLNKAVFYLKKAANNRFKNKEAQAKIEELYASGVLKKDDL